MLTLYFDHASPRAVLALLELEAVLDAERATGRPATVGIVGIDALGLDAPVPVTLDQLAELERVRGALLAHGLAARAPRLRPSTARSYVVGEVAEGAGLGRAWRLACARALWVDGLDLGDPRVLAGLAAGVGLDAARVADALADPAALATVRRRAGALARRGIGGVPVLEVDGALVAADLDRPALVALLRLA